MKKSLVLSAVSLLMTMPVFAEEQFINDSAHAGDFPVFGNENQERANLGLESITSRREEIAKAKARNDDRQEQKKKSEANEFANGDIDNRLNLKNGRIKKGEAKRILSEDDPDYVPPENKSIKAHNKDNSSEAAASVPISLNGDHLEYEKDTGDFSASGNVRINQGATVLVTDYCYGNFNTGDVYLLKGGTLLSPGNRASGNWVHYNFNNKTGEIKEIVGRGTKDYFKAPHAVVMPDKIVADQGGTTTRCTAKKHVPCMHVEAKAIEIYPQEKMVAHDVKCFIKGVQIYSRKLWINEFNKESKQYILPKVGWHGKDDGFYGQLKYKQSLTDKDDVKAIWTQYSRVGFKPQYSYTHDEKNWDFRYFFGWDEDDDYWYKKENDFRLRYKPHHFIKGVPLTLSLNWEYGLWSRWNPKTHSFEIPMAGLNSKKSWHNEYAYYVNHDPIKLFSRNTTLHLTYGRKWTHESLNKENIVTNVYYQTIRQRINDDLFLWVGNMREKHTSQMFGLGQPDMEREFRVGVQYKPTKNDVLSVVDRYSYGHNNKDRHGQYKTIYNWYHRFCCWAFQISYEKEWYKNDRSIKAQYFFYNW